MRGLVKFRIVLEEVAQRCGPGLVAQQVELGDDADIPLPAGRHQFLDVCLRKGVLIPELRMGFVLVVVIDAQHQRVDLQGDQHFSDEVDEFIHVLRLRRCDSEAADGQDGIEPGLGQRRNGEQEGRGEKKDSFFHDERAMLVSGTRQNFSIQ